MDTAAVTRGIAEMKTALNDLKTYAARQFTLIRTQAQKEGNAMTGWIPSFASRLIGSLSTGISGGGTRIGNALRSAINAAANAVSSDMSRFTGIGSNVISGIIRGIQGTASSLWNTLRAVANNMLSTLKNALGIQSPSRVMRDEVGRQIGAGIAGGMLDCREQIASAAQTLANDAAAGVQIPVSAAGTLLRGAVVPLSSAAVRGGQTGSETSSGGRSRSAPAIGGNTFIFQKPVQTPYQHAQEIQKTMEEMLYGT